MREIMLILHFIGLAMGIGTSFGFMFIGIASAKMNPEEGLKFRMHAMVLSRMGHIGLGLLIISGLFLMSPYWSMLASSPLLMVKLLLVLVLAALIGIVSSIGRKIVPENAEAQFKRIEPLGKLSMLTGLIILVLAVYVFH